MTKEQFSNSTSTERPQNTDSNPLCFSYPLEASPAEGATYRFAKIDQKTYPDIFQAGVKEAPYYTNSSQLPVGHTDDPFEALEHQEALQSLYTGGTVLHLYLGERVSSSDSCKNLVKKALENFKLPYITVTPTFSICPQHGYLQGEHEFCPHCDEQILRKKVESLESSICKHDINQKSFEFNSYK